MEPNTNLQSVIACDVYVLPPLEANVGEDRIWKRRKCPYGLNDAARQFYQSVEEELKAIGFVHCSVDPALFFLTKDGQLLGFVGTHIDDFIYCGKEGFDEEVMNRLRKRFTPGKLEEGSFTYVGFEIEQHAEGILMGQDQYIEELRTFNIKPERARDKQGLLDKNEKKQFRSLIGKCNWAMRGTRPDLCYDVIEMSSKLKQRKVDDLLRVNKVINQLKEFGVTVFYPYIGSVETWDLLVVCDASFANLSDGVSSCGGHIILIVGERSKCCVIAWMSKKIKRVVRWTLVVEMLSLTEALEHAIYSKKILTEVLIGPALNIFGVVGPRHPIM